MTTLDQIIELAEEAQKVYDLNPSEPWPYTDFPHLIMKLSRTLRFAIAQRNALIGSYVSETKVAWVIDKANKELEALLQGEDPTQ